MKKSVYFPGLNGLRFFAAFAVIFHHIEQTKFWDNLPNAWGTPFIDALGHKGVSLFFVLSGFLITYLLLAELQVTNTINLPKFYMRRALRIWPLYYLIIIVSFFVLPLFLNYGGLGVELNTKFWPKLLLYFFFLPNLGRVLFFPILGAYQVWSVGVEEQFYFIWPFLVRVFKKSILPFLLLFISIKMIIGFGLNMLEVSLNGKFGSVAHLWQLFQIEQMAVGAIGAYFLYHENQRVLNIVYNRFTQIFMAVMLVIMFIVPFSFFGGTLVEAIVFIILILNISTNRNFVLKLENKYYIYLGNISYSIYMFHTACIALALYLLEVMSIQKGNFIVFQILFTLLSIVLTVGASILSYTYFEKYFLKFKDSFAIIKSGTQNNSKTAG